MKMWRIEQGGISVLEENGKPFTGEEGLPPLIIFDVDSSAEIKKIYNKHDKNINRTMIHLIGIMKVSHIDHFALSFSVVYKPNHKREILIKPYGEYITYIEFLHPSTSAGKAKLWLRDTKKVLMCQEERFALTFLSKDVYKITDCRSEVIITHVACSDDYKKLLEEKHQGTSAGFP